MLRFSCAKSPVSPYRALRSFQLSCKTPALCMASFRFRPLALSTGLTFRSASKIIRLPRIAAGFITGAIDGYGSRDQLLARPTTGGHISDSDSSAREFVPRFLQTPLRNTSASCVSLAVQLHQVGNGLSFSSCRSCSAHNEEATRQRGWPLLQGRIVPTEVNRQNFLAKSYESKNRGVKGFLGNKYLCFQ